MLKKFKQALTTVITASALLFPVAVPVMVHAQSNTIADNVCKGTNITILGNGTCADATTNGAEGRADKLIKNIIDLFSAFVGIVAVVMIVFGGFKYITSGGNDGNVSTAKNTILYAVIGLVIVALAQVIVKYVLSKAVA